MDDTPNRSSIKSLLDKILIKDIQKIYRLLNKIDRKIMIDFLSIYEIKSIKSAFRKLSSKSVINESVFEFENWQNVVFKNIKGIENVSDYEEFKKFFKKTQYYKILDKFDTDIDKINIFKFENELDKLYFEKMIKVSDNYNTTLADIIGKQSDLNNISWIFRIKRNFKFSSEEIKEILISSNYKLKKQEIDELINCENEQEILQILKKTYYAQFIDFTNLNNLEANIDSYMYGIYQKYFRGSIFDIGVIYAYIKIVEMENNDIMNIVEGIRYNLDRQEIRKKLVC